tara:strand:- start:220 stop:615 length:396 start_codon:yes stop_codon:yes gene_type:complete
MKKVTNFDKANLQALRVEMDNALKGLEKKFGITIKAGNASYSGNECTFKVKCNTIGTDGTVITKESRDWDRHKGFHNLSHLNVGDTITIQGSPYILSGFNTRARKAPINFKNAAGAGYKCSVRMLQMENSK